MAWLAEDASLGRLRYSPQKVSSRADSRLRALYQTLQPRLQELDARRVKIRNTIVAGVVTAALGVSSCVTAFDPPAFLASQPAWRFGPMAFALLTLFLFGLAVARMLVPGVTGYRNYRAHFKKDVVAALVRAAQRGARYFPDRHVGRQAYDESRLFRTQLDKFRGDDLLQGTFGDTPYECSELEASYTTGSGDDRKTHSVFTGLFMRIDLDRDLAGHTVVEPAGSKGGARGGMEKVALDDQFDEAFEVWSTRPDEARALLVPELRARLLELHDDAFASLHFAFTGRVVYTAADYRRQLFEPSLATALREKDLAALAAPLDVAGQVVKALGLERRRRPADASFHSAEVAGGVGMSGLAARMAGADVGIHDVMEAVAEESAAAPVIPPANPYPRILDTGAGVCVRYPVTVATLMVLAIGALLTPMLLATAWNWASPSFAAELRPLLQNRLPDWSPAGETLIEYPTAFLLVTLFLWWMFVGTLLYRPGQVTVDHAGVTIKRLLVPVSLNLPIDVIRRVDSSNRSVSFVRSDRSLLRSFVMASPNMPSDSEARWLAAQFRQALKRAGWRPAAR